MLIDTEQGYGIFPEKGINSTTSARVENHKRTAYGHVYQAILVSTRSVSTRTVRNRSKQPSLRLPLTPSSLVGRVVEDLRDTDLDHAVFMAGLLTSFDSTSELFHVNWTDGSMALPLLGLWPSLLPSSCLLNLCVLLTNSP